MLQAKILHISDKILFEGPLEKITLPGVMGNLEIVEFHVPIVSLLAGGTIEIRENANDKAGKFFPIRQGLIRFDGQDLYAVVE